MGPGQPTTTPAPRRGGPLPTLVQADGGRFASMAGIVIPPGRANGISILSFRAGMSIHLFHTFQSVNPQFFPARTGPLTETIANSIRATPLSSSWIRPRAARGKRSGELLRAVRNGLRMAATLRPPAPIPPTSSRTFILIPVAGGEPRGRFDHRRYQLPNSRWADPFVHTDGVGRRSATQDDIAPKVAANPRDQNVEMSTPNISFRTNRMAGSSPIWSLP